MQGADARPPPDSERKPRGSKRCLPAISAGSPRVPSFFTYSSVVETISPHFWAAVSWFVTKGPQLLSSSTSVRLRDTRAAPWGGGPELAEQTRTGDEAHLFQYWSVKGRQRATKYKYIFHCH